MNAEIQKLLVLIQKVLGLISEEITPMPHITKLDAFCRAIQDYEGYIPPSKKYPNGTPAWRNHNPGNLRCMASNKTNWNRLAIGSNNNFCVFPTDDVGLQALKNVISYAAQGKSKIYKPSMNLYQFFDTYSPSTDGNHPIAYAEWVAKELSVDPHTFTISQLV